MSIFNQKGKAMLLPVSPAKEMNYTEITTCWQDFSIADRFGEKAIRDTYNRLFNQWKENHTKEITELTLVLNWKIWQHYEQGNEALTQVYNELWEKMDLWCQENLKDDDLDYYYHTTD